ncbi:MAG: hypothetical protein QHH75_12460 [Bacillota bacterium]|nr:hypothetical protein [Bacillota bacterium]
MKRSPVIVRGTFTFRPVIKIDTIGREPHGGGYREGSERPCLGNDVVPRDRGFVFLRTGAGGKFLEIYREREWRR